MSVRIAIVGLGKIGGSIGLALAEHKDRLYRTGHDINFETAKKAEKAGAIDKASMNLIATVEDADLIILALPMDQIRSTLEIISSELKDGAVVMDTGLVKQSVAEWTEELLPEGRFYVGITPVLNPVYLTTNDRGFDSAHADLFKQGMLGIAAPKRTSSDAIKLASDLSTLVNAEPFFVDIFEIDGLMAMTHILPQLAAASLINVTVNQPGWREARKVAGQPYASNTGQVLVYTDMRALSEAARYGRQNVIRVIDDLINGLYSVRDNLDKEDYETLERSLNQAHEARVTWWHQRQKANWLAEELPPTELPSSGERLGQWIGIRKKPKKTGS